MIEFEQQAARLQAELEYLSGLPFNELSDAGYKGIYQIATDGVTREQATFTDHFSIHESPPPTFVIKAMCIGAAYLSAGRKAFKKGDPSANDLLIATAEEVGFIHGAAFGVMYGDDAFRAEKSAHGRLGGNKRAEKNAVLKAWAISQNVEMVRGTATDKARRLMLKVPKELTDSFDNPERIIREAINAEMKKTAT